MQDGSINKVGGNLRKILLITFVCKPNEGSESGVGWNYINMIRNICKDDEIYVLVWKGENQEELLSKYNKKFKFIFFDIEESIKSKFKSDFNKGLKLMELYYIIWQKKALKYIKNTYGIDYFDIVQHITFVSATLPSYFINLESNFIWGPISSNKLIPYKIVDRKVAFLKLLAKDISKKLIRKMNYTFNKNLYKSKAVIINTQSVAKELGIKREFHEVSSIGIEACINNNLEVKKKSKHLNIAFIGAFMDIKNYDLAIEGFAKYNKSFDKLSKLYLIGDGDSKSKKNVDRLIKLNEIENNVIRTGWINREALMDLMKETVDILLFPTCEQAGMVILESIRLGIPIVGLNFGGPKELTNGNGSELVDIDDKNTVVDNLAKAIIKIDKNYEYYSKEAIIQSEKYTWNSIEKRLYEIYKEI